MGMHSFQWGHLPHTLSSFWGRDPHLTQCYACQHPTFLQSFISIPSAVFVQYRRVTKNQQPSTTQLLCLCHYCAMHHCVTRRAGAVKCNVFSFRGKALWPSDQGFAPPPQTPIIGALACHASSHVHIDRRRTGSVDPHFLEWGSSNIFWPPRFRAETCRWFSFTEALNVNMKMQGLSYLDT